MFAGKEGTFHIQPTILVYIFPEISGNEWNNIFLEISEKRTM